MLRFVSVLPLFLFASVAAAAERTVTFAVENMTCALCPITVRTAMERVTGVKDVRVDFESKTAIVVFDDREASVEDISERSRRAGYPAIPKERE